MNASRRILLGAFVLLLIAAAIAVLVLAVLARGAGGD